MDLGLGAKDRVRSGGLSQFNAMLKADNPLDNATPWVR